MGRKAKVEPEKYCRICGIRLNRNRIGESGRLEDLGVFKRRKYCSLKCANTRLRPSHWVIYHWRARKHRKLSCEACGWTEHLHAHHVDGKPENNKKENIQTLCVYCHNFLHATAARCGWTELGRLPALQGWTDLKPSETQSFPRP